MLPGFGIVLLWYRGEQQLTRCKHLMASAPKLSRFNCKVEKFLSNEVLSRSSYNFDHTRDEERKIVEDILKKDGKKGNSIEFYLTTAVEEGQTSVVEYLLSSGLANADSSPSKLKPLHLASQKGHLDIVRVLLHHGASIDTGDLTPLMRAAVNGHQHVVSYLLGLGAHIGKKNSLGSTALHLACEYGHVQAVNVLLGSAKCSTFIINGLNDRGYTPLMSAAAGGHHKTARELVLKGAKVNCRNHDKDTALHIAARYGHIQCMFFLIESGANIHAKNRNSKTPLQYNSHMSMKSMSDFHSFKTKKSVCIIGNAYSGKSTLISSLQEESTSKFGKVINKFRKVDDMRQRTTGIEPVLFNSKKYGEVVFFDFAGQHEYHGPHEAFMGPLISGRGSTATLVFVVNATYEEAAISSHLHRWLHPVSLMCSAANPVRVIVVGSFADRIVSKSGVKGKFSRLASEVMSYKSFSFQGFCLIDCRKPESHGLQQLRCYLSQTPYPSLMVFRTYSIFQMISCMKSKLNSKIIQLDSFRTWLHENSETFPSLPPAEEVCKDVAATGHYLYIPNRSNPDKSCLILDPQAILQEVYGTLFSVSKTNTFGLVQLSKLFPSSDVDMIRTILTSFEFCVPVDPDMLTSDLLELMDVVGKEDDLVFLPSLVSSKRPESYPFDISKSIHLCWDFQMVAPHIISPRLLQTIILRLSAHFVFRHKPTPDIVLHCCDIWWNGIAWKSTKGVDVTVQIIDNTLIQVISSCIPGSASVLADYLCSVVSDILQTCRQLSPSLMGTSSIIRPRSIQNLFTNPRIVISKECFLLSSIACSIEIGDKFVLSLPNGSCIERCSLKEMFAGIDPNLEMVTKMHWHTEVLQKTLNPILINKSELCSLLKICTVHVHVHHAMCSDIPPDPLTIV